jgi:hypothetical protein
MTDLINVGAAGNDHTGDPIRTGGQKINTFAAAMLALLPWPKQIIAGENLSAKDPVYLVSSGSPATLVMMRADATDTTKPADGFVISAVSVGVAGGFYPLGIPLNSPDSPAPLVVGTRYYVAVGGGLTSTMPSTTLNGQQEIGIALDGVTLLTYLKPMNEAP